MASAVTELEEISPSLEPAHAFVEAIKIAPKLDNSNIIVVDSCGDSLKDRDIIKKHLGKLLKLILNRNLLKII